jgi:AcrR family transcriptional regulator
VSADELWEAVPAGAARELLLAALEAFAERGFHATTTREIGTRVGLSPAAVYVHYPSKADLLYRIAIVGHTAVLAEIERALAAASAPPERLRAFVATMAAWHAANNTLARVIQYELRSLPEDQRAEIAGLRRRFNRLMRGELSAGAASGDFDLPDIRGTADALLSLCIDVARWYQPGTRGRAPASIGRLYGELALRTTRPIDG